MKQDLPTSIYTRLHALSRARKESFQLTLNAYARERLLYRLGRSPHRKQFILKGATLFTVWAGNPYRSTMDVDFLGQGKPLSDAVRATFKRRKTAIPTGVPEGLTPEFSRGAPGLALWENFVRRTAFSKRPAPFPEICETLRGFLMPVTGALAAGARFNQRWEPGGPWTRKVAGKGVK